MANQRNLGFLAKPKNPQYAVGKKQRTVQATAALVTAAMANGDTVELAGPLTYDSRVARVFTPNASPALTSAVDVKLGFFMKDASGNLALIKAGSDAVLWNGVTLAAALTTRDLLLDRNPTLNTTQNIGQLLAQTTDQEPQGGVYLVMTFPTKPSVNGTLDLDIAIEEATTV